MNLCHSTAQGKFSRETFFYFYRETWYRWWWGCVPFNQRYFSIIRKKTCGPRNAIFSNFIFKEFK